MRCQRIFVLASLLACSLPAPAKSKKKVILPADILRAETVLVVVDPMAGTEMTAPLANRTARENVEKAIMNWGRFRLANDLSTADLVIVVRKGNGKIAQPTIGGMPDNRPVVFEPSDSGGRIGIGHGTPPMGGDPSAPRPATPNPQIEAGPPEDMFAVYRGERDHPLEFPPVWRYSAKNALESPDVPAIEKFRKAIAEAEKQQSSKP